MYDQIIFHVDVNSAYLSWEALNRLQADPSSEDIRTIAAIIGGDMAKRHGVVLAKSSQAKQYGIRTGEPVTNALRKCPQLQLFPPNHNLYSQYSRQLMEILTDYAPAVDQYSIDEAFLDMSHTQLVYGKPVAAATALKDRIYQELGFTVNIGISTNKLLAKMASDFEKPNRVHTLFPEEISMKMWPLPVRDLFFVGGAAEKKLHELGIYTIGDLANTDQELIRSHMKKQGELIHSYANGIDLGFVEKNLAAAKGYSNEVTLPFDVTDPIRAKWILLSLCEQVCSRLRQANVLGTTIAISMTDYNFKKSTHQCTPFVPTNTTETIYEIVCQLFDEAWDGTPIRLLGCGANKITEVGIKQLSFFENDKEEKYEKLDTAIDNIRNKFGKNAIMRASFLPADQENLPE